MSEKSETKVIYGLVDILQTITNAFDSVRSNVSLLIPNPLLLPIESILKIKPQAKVTIISKVDEERDKEIFGIFRHHDSLGRIKFRKIASQDMLDYCEYIAFDRDGGEEMLIAFRDEFMRDWSGIYSTSDGFKNVIIGETLGRQALSISRELKIQDFPFVNLTLEDIAKKYSLIRNNLINNFTQNKLQKQRTDELLIKRKENLQKILNKFLKISINDMVKLLDFDDDISLKKWLMDLPNDINLRIEESMVIIPDSLRDDSKRTSEIIDYLASSMVITCFYCGFPIEKTNEFCPSCQRRILKCSVCKLPISFGDTTGKCSLCDSIGHYNHLEEWVKTQGKCPSCLRKIPVDGITIIDFKIKK